MGSSQKSDWSCFRKAASKYKNIIFVVSAGNNGFDIDQNLIYPASFDLDNIITVTSSDQNGRLGRGSNFGKKSVDFMIPAERVEVLDHRGIKAFTGGTSYAAPRMTAMISRYLEKNPNKSVKDVINVLKKRSIKTNQNRTKYGWIPDPLDNYLFN
jgi:subtilisin family serine protease